MCLKKMNGLTWQDVRGWKRTQRTAQLAQALFDDNH
jgi:hypothetical protein